MEPSIKDETCKSNERKRRHNTGSLERDLLRWQRKRATIEKFKEEKFGGPKTDRGVELSVRNLRQ